MNHRKCVLLFVAMINVALVTAQNESPNQNQSQTLREGSIEIVQDPRIEDLLQKHISINEAKPFINGYRIQIFFASGTNSRKMANDTKTHFIAKYPEITAHVKHEPPNFKVRLGDYRTKLEATKVLNEIKRDFPGAFIVKDEINLPKID